jgi:hypothetical protein
LMTELVLGKVRLYAVLGTGRAVIADIGNRMAPGAIFDAYHLPVGLATFRLIHGGTAGDEKGGQYAEY